MARRNLPELMGMAEAAQTVGTTTSNLDKIAGLPEPEYGPDHPNPKRRLMAGRLWLAEDIREFARERNARLGRVEQEAA